ncbi:hypothetical protein Kpho02_66710 [Kitasatospora phosalacinea]|uniref:Uncharacterized protein n=1 Tax=Kitasatospora phosalacinea TaxID=2065 RepID=A0A9W6V5K0_9ACTN|nr:hypothetical protein Kpho02_66710 [Kitasatospora phosalacinea]
MINCRVILGDSHALRRVPRGARGLVRKSRCGAFRLPSGRTPIVPNRGVPAVPLIGRLSRGPGTGAGGAQIAYRQVVNR